MLGGYQTINFGGATLSEETTIKGAFKKAKTGKAILVENIAGISGFTYDATPTSTESAICPLIVVLEGVPTIVELVIADDDGCSIVVPE